MREKKKSYTMKDHLLLAIATLRPDSKIRNTKRLF
jgi:hypothetical protein